MIINSSTVGMAAQTRMKTTYTSRNETLVTCLNTGEQTYGGNFFSANYERSSSGGTYSKFEGSVDSKGAASSKLLSVRQKDSTKELIEQLRMYLFQFRNRLTMMIGRRKVMGIGNISNVSNYSSNTLDLTTGTYEGKTVWNRINYSSYTYEESESMDFETVGKVFTADGRTIDFNMQVSMTREYVESVESLTENTTVVLTDPLVISLNTNPVSVSDQKWQFDIDGDGKIDNISLLSKGQGFLVYDQNQDGIINNGLEMFGAATGNGFRELAAYDEDGNGWIDENDSIYNKLSVWIKDDAGNDKIVNLKEADVGAIYLGSMETKFALKSDKDNSQNAEIRSSGVYLSEDGTAKSISQLDMVKALIS